MTMRIGSRLVWAACLIAATPLAVAGSVPARADGGCPGSFVPRNAQPGDLVCVTPQVAAEVAQENANAANLRQPNGGAYGPLTCKPGYVWREAFVGDGVCVTPDRRTESLNENTTAAVATPPSAVPPNAGRPPAPQVTTTTSTQNPTTTYLPTPTGVPTPTTTYLPTPTGVPTPTTTIPAGAGPPPACDPRIDICVH